MATKFAGNLAKAAIAASIQLEDAAGAEHARGKYAGARASGGGAAGAGDAFLAKRHLGALPACRRSAKEYGIDRLLTCKKVGPALAAGTAPPGPTSFSADAPNDTGGDTGDRLGFERICEVPWTSGSPSV